MKRSFFIFLFLTAFCVLNTFAGNNEKTGGNLWSEVSDKGSRQMVSEQSLPIAYRVFSLDQDSMKNILRQAPEEFTAEAAGNPFIITMPMPDGSLARFRVEHSLVVEPGLAMKYPELGETYRGQGIDDPTATVRFDFLPSGFHSMIRSVVGTVLIDPFAQGERGEYITYYKRDAQRTESFVCDLKEDNIASVFSTNKPSKFKTADLIPDSAAPEAPSVTSGSTLRTYRLALAATGEYTAAVGGGTVSGALAAQVLIMNRVNGVYERDLDIHMNIIANNNLIVYTDGTTDPYTNNNGSTMLGQNTTNLNTVIGTANYDIGHVFSTGGGGVATLNGPCGSSKARGVTGLQNPVGDPFAIDYVAHEMGHQWGANHTFNGAVDNCEGGNRSASSAYEPGSGITIMAYASICGNQDLSNHSIDTFHVKSLEVIVAYSQTGTGNNCAVPTATGNTAPIVTSVGGTSFNIPKQTPFALTASATDIDNDSITYDWQEYDLGPSTTSVPNTDTDAARPIFRPYLPTVSGTRTFPSLQYILNNANVPPSTTGGYLTGEMLPSIGRTMNFQAIARDNRAGGGGINTVTTSVVVDANSGPFVVTAPNSNVTWNENSTQTVAWDIANTTNAPVNAANVDILMSTDGGVTFPITLAANTPNDGSQIITVPASTATTNARIKIKASNNIFFDISDTNFSIVSGTAASVSISGRVTNNAGVGIANAIVSLTNSQNQTISVYTNSFGYFNISNVSAGTTYTASVASRRYTFSNATITPSNSVSNFNFTSNN